VNPTRPSIASLVVVATLIALALTTFAARLLLGPSSTRPSVGMDRSATATDTEPPQTDGAQGPSDVGFAVWGLTADGEPLRWDACQPIDLVLSPEGAPIDAEIDLLEAAARIAAASGLQLRLLGQSDERPSSDRPLVVRDGSGWRWNHVLVAWMSLDEAGAASLPLAPGDRGVAIPVSVRDGAREGFVTGQVVLNGSRSDLRPGFDDRADSWGATLLHELGHLVGLAHVADASQLMAADPGSGPPVLGSGDLAGLALIGASAGCTDVPDPAAGRTAVRSAPTP
jgi:hypothetical protein